MKKIYFALLLFFSINSFSQFSKTHYIPPLSNSDSQPPQGQYMYISCPSTTAVKFNIKQIGGGTISGTVSRDKPYVLNTIGSGSNTQLMVSKSNVGKVLKNKGFVVEAEDLVYVTVRLTSTTTNDQAGGLVAKGLAALGTHFRVGAFTNTQVDNSAADPINSPPFVDNLYTFASVIASENNTKVSFSVPKPGVTLVNNIPATSSVILNQGESYVIAVQGIKYNNVNNDGLIGALITSDKPIAVNCGSFAGTNAKTNLDLGFDQIVSAERTGNEYIFVRGIGPDILEKPLIVADTDNTNVYVNGSTTPYNSTPLKAGDYVGIDGAQYINGNMYVKTTNTAGVNTNVFAYQCLGGTAPKFNPNPDLNVTGWPNQNMEFVPPLSCQTPKVINNIPFINSVGALNNFTGTVCVVTEAQADLTFIINGNNYTLAQLPTGVTYSGPNAVTGNDAYATYNFNGLTGNISVFSTKQVYVSYYGSSGNATYGGFYSGFTFKPEVAFGQMDLNAPDCLPNINLSVNTLTAFNNFQWFLNGTEIDGATGNNYVPTIPGSYSVKASIAECDAPALNSDEIPVSICPPDSDTDGANDNIDIDLDNDGIANCTESYGNKGLDLSGSAATVIQGSYSNSYTSATTATGTQSPVSFYGKSDGTFVSQATPGDGNSLKQTFTFAKPISLLMEYVATANTADLLSSYGDFILEVPIANTITVLDPDGQLLIDTNYDGVYESGVTQYSSFQLRFRLNNGGLPLTAGTGTFKFVSRLVSSFSFTHKDLSDTANNRATFKLSASCLPRDTDNDGVSDEIDLDDDNDGIPDLVEALGKNYAVIPLKDINNDGMNDAYAPGLGSLDSDSDGVPDYLDLDSDNDGIYDLVEAGHKATDADSNGIIDGSPSAFGADGFFDTLETAPDSGKMNYTVASTDTDGYQNYIDSDSDDDGCFDVVEAGFSDPDGDGYLGSNPLSVNASGKVTSVTDGYTPLSNDNYIVGAPIIITTQPADQSTCDAQDAVFTLTTNTIDAYQWQLSTGGTSYSDINDDAIYSGSQTGILHLAKVTPAMNGYKYRVVLRKNGNSCNLHTASATLTVLARPQVAPTVTLVQCDDNTDGLSDFNLKQIENQISADYASETFTYFNSSAGANANDATSKIANPTVYNNSNGNTVWARVENADGCFDVSQMNLVVSSTQIPASTLIPFTQCDDYVDASNDDKDGVTAFDFQSATASIISMLPANAAYDVKYYKTEQEALQETDEQGNSLAIADADVSNYRNIGYPNSETIWVRIDSSIPNACVGLGPYVQLTVNPVPDVELNHDEVICSSSTEAVELNAGLLSGTQSDYSYEWSKNGGLLPQEQAYDLAVTTDGVYTCEVKDNQTGCVRIRTNNVTYSETTVIKDVAIADLTLHNTVTVASSNPDNSEYSLDNPTGPFQDSNVFENVGPGIHIVYLNDKKGCGIDSKTIAVVGAPPFFTPNGDGFNDKWKLQGIDDTFFKNTSVEIFDRYGKLLKLLSDATSDGWDGTYNSRPQPADDYWFVVKMEDGRVSKGHFALKR